MLEFMEKLSAMRSRLDRINRELNLARSLPERREKAIKALRPKPERLDLHYRQGFSIEDLDAVVDRTMAEMVGFEVCEANKARRREILRIARELDDIRDDFPKLLLDISGGLADLSRQLQKEGKE